MSVVSQELLKRYLERCLKIFKEHRSELFKVVSFSFPGAGEPNRHNRQFLEKAITNAENTEEFEAFARSLAAGPLASDLERLTEEAVKRGERKQGESLNASEYRENTAHQAAKSFFKNTGTYLNLWHDRNVNESDLIEIIESYTRKGDSEIIRLFVFDGFVLYDNGNEIKNISLPVGELRKYTEQELENLLRLPQSSWHGFVNPDITKKAAIWYILTVREKAAYRGMGGLLGWFPIREITEKGSDTGLVGPIFLCIGRNANLAVEIRVRTNVFEDFPVYEKVRNNYLPYDSFDEDGEPKPRTFINHVGEAGEKLKKVFEIWHKVNELHSKGLLRYPTEAYVRSVMSLHNSEMSLYNSEESLMQAYVGFVTVLESLLTPGTRQELANKIAIRGAALLATKPRQRLSLLEILNEFYKIRSRIVHEGHTGEKDREFEIISSNLSEISRQIFLRYICLIYLGLEGELPEWVLPNSGDVSLNDRRSKAIRRILEGSVLAPELTELLENKMKTWGLYEDWVQMTTYCHNGRLS